MLLILPSLKPDTRPARPVTPLVPA